MLTTGITRPVDELGRIVIPKELRKSLEINIKDPLEIFVDGNMILLKKYEPGCIFCSNMSDISTYKGKMICPECFNELRQL